MDPYAYFGSNSQDSASKAASYGQETRAYGDISPSLSAVSFDSSLRDFPFSLPTNYSQPYHNDFPFSAISRQPNEHVFPVEHSNSNLPYYGYDAGGRASYDTPYSRFTAFSHSYEQPTRFNPQEALIAQEMQQAEILFQQIAMTTRILDLEISMLRRNMDMLLEQTHAMYRGNSPEQTGNDRTTLPQPGPERMNPDPQPNPDAQPKVEPGPDQRNSPQDNAYPQPLPGPDRVNPNPQPKPDTQPKVEPGSDQSNSTQHRSQPTSEHKQTGSDLSNWKTHPDSFPISNTNPGPEHPFPYPQQFPDQNNQQTKPHYDRHHGVNLAGAEFDPEHVPGTYGSNYTFPTAQELDYYKQHGQDLVRVPFLWERMQPGLLSRDSNQWWVDRTFAPDYSRRLDEFLMNADTRGMKVILDEHGYGRYHDQVIGAGKINNDDFKQFWSQMARRYGHHSSIYGYDLMNEPHDEENKTWFSAAQSAVDGIRQAGDKHAVIVEGNNWSSAGSWPWANSELAINDPEKNVIYSAHTYWDSDHSGRYGGEKSFDTAVKDAREKGILGPNEDTANLGVNQVRPFVEWLKHHNARGLIGEFGVPANDANWVRVQDKFLAYARANDLDTTAWGGGPWWGSEYPLSLEQGPKGDGSTYGPVPLNLRSLEKDGNNA